MLHKLTISVKIVLLCLFAALVLIAVTFGFEGWLIDLATDNQYGIWRACLASTSICASWNQYAFILINFSLSVYYIWFQILQSLMLGITFFTFMFLAISAKCCAKDMCSLVCIILSIIFSGMEYFFFD